MGGAMANDERCRSPVEIFVDSHTIFSTSGRYDLWSQSANFTQTLLYAKTMIVLEMYSEDGSDWKVAKRFVKRERNVEMKFRAMSPHI
jgi:hypothetical protein